MIVHHPMVEHQEASVKGSSFQAISILFKGLKLGGKPAGRITGEDESPLFHCQHSYDKVNQYLIEVLTEYYEEKPGYVELNSSLLQTVILLLLRNQQAAPPPSLSSVSEKVKAYIEENFRLELTLSDLAEIVHVSSYHLAHVFKEEVGVSPIQYLIRCRIEEAKKLLLQTDLSVADISAEVGYPNANYFNILFKKVTGANPGKFRSKRG
ncbi:helix-turn-helix domain-containing protein [Cohnella thermotolerans]|uniref:helix-turn-helix domain-containing protein n=1 Tax=Cohnella thermotolerans TaxID=329858 RepID=UPI0012EBC783|nr:AraC family transcriptional regulator [Cohnella thermotolerans]